EVLELLCRELELADDDVDVIDGPLDLGGLWSIYALARPAFKAAHWLPQTPVVLQGGDPAPDFFRLLRNGDVLVHHPYDSFSTSVEQFVETAASAPPSLTTKPPAPPPHRPRDKADHLPPRGRRELVGELAGQGGGVGQAGGGAGRAEGPLRRAGEHRPGPRAPRSTPHHRHTR